MKGFILSRIKYIAKEDYLYIFGIFLLSSVSFFWFNSPTLLSGVGDFSFVYSPTNQFLGSLFTWSEQNLGVLVSRNVATIFFYYLPIKILAFSGMSLTNIEHLLFLFFLFLSGFGMYKLIGHLLNNKRLSKPSAFLGANLYMFNMYTLQFQWHHVLSLFSYSLLPLILLYFIKLIDTRKYRYIFIIGLLSFLASPSGDNPLYFGMIIIPVVCYFIYDMAISFLRKEKKITISRLKIFILSISIIILINSFWILPNLVTVSTQITGILEQPASSIKFIAGIESSINVADSYRFLGHWGFNGDYKGWAYTPYHTIYYTPLFIGIGFLIIIVALISLFYSTKKVLFFALMAIASFGLIQGPNPPLGLVYSYLWGHIHIFRIYRRPLDKFGIFYVFSIAVMLSVGIQYIFSKLLKTMKKVKINNLYTVFLFFLIIINLYAFPFWTGEIFPHYPPESPLTGGRIVLPHYYTSIEKVIDLKKDTEILGLPGGGGGITGYWVPYKWKYHGVDPLYSYFPTYYYPQINPKRNYPYGIITTNIYNMERRGNLKKLKNVLKYTNVEYIFLRKDVNLNFYPWIMNPEKEEKLLNNISYIKYLDQHGQILIYSINNQPHFYTSSRVVLIKKYSRQIPIFSLDIFQNISLFFLMNDLSPQKSNFIENEINSTTIKISKIRNIRVYDSDELLNFNWNHLQNNNIIAIYYLKGKSVIRTDGKEGGDTLSFPSLKAAPYKFPSFSKTGWSAAHSTLVYIKTGNKPLKIGSILENGKSVKGVVGIWWETGWMGMGTKPVEFPVIIPPDQRAIIQIYPKTENLSIATIGLENLSKLKNIKENNRPLVIFKRINPTKYIVNVENATKPFFLVFSESYNPGWKIYSMNKNTDIGKVIARYPDVNVEEAKNSWYKFTPQDVVYLLRKPAVNESYHFEANGYANAWYINPEKIDKDGSGNFTLTIYFRPQSYFYLGLFISMITLILSIGYLFYDWRRDKEDRWAKRLEKRFKR